MTTNTHQAIIESLGRYARKMRAFDGKSFERVFLDQEPSQVFEGIEFRRCSFASCHFSRRDDPRYRSVARSIHVKACSYNEVAGPSAGLVEDVLVEDLKTEGTLQTWGLAFRHMTLRGKIGTIMLSQTLMPTSATPQEAIDAFLSANREYYESVDWALDISQGEFKDCDIRGVPARLIRRDPDTQVVVKREKALERTWKNLDLSRTWWPTSIEFMLNRGDSDVVLVAPKRSRQFKELLAGLHLLRKAGVAEPD